MFKKLALVACTLPMLVACSADESAQADAPSVDDAEMSEKDWGSSFGSWSMTVYGQSTFYNGSPQSAYYGFLLTDSSSSGQTRGGGYCMVNAMGTSCNTGADSQCGTNDISNLQAPWHYCYNYQCYIRPGTTAPATSQGTYCSLNPSRAAGYHTTMRDPWDALNFHPSHVLACMTKDPGPNTSCGTGGPSTYMRTVVPYVGESCYPSPYGGYQCDYY